MHRNPTAYGDLTGVNLGVWALTHILVSEKFLAIFSMLFGAGIVLMAQRAESSGANPARLHYRRMGWLILFGLLHAHLLWYGDILYSYGMCGLLVYLFRAKSPRQLIAVALAFAVIGDLVRYRNWLVAIGAFLGIPAAGLGVIENFARNWDIRYSLYFGSQWNYWASYAVALGWTGLVMLWCQSTLLTGLKSRAAALGRMAFSNYILQTLVCTAIFYGHGFGHFGNVSRTWQTLIALAIGAMQLMLAPVWLKHFSFGPLEWFWRRLTYGAPQPFWR